MFKNFRTRYRIFPRQWLLGIKSYSKYIGYIKPCLLKGKDVEYKIWRKLLRDAWHPRELSLPVGKRILAISPHSDDEAIGAGGILWAHRDCAEIHVVLLTDGVAGGNISNEEEKSDRDQRAELAGVRKDELLETTGALNAKSVTFFDLPDGEMAAEEGAASKLQSVLQEVKPDVVILPWFLDGHPDHQAANRLFSKACNNSKIMVLGYEIWAMSEPNAYFDISEHLEAKLTLVKNYVSQLKVVDYITFVEGLAYVRGYQMISKNGKKAAEAFVALPAEDYCDLVNEIL